MQYVRILLSAHGSSVGSAVVKAERLQRWKNVSEVFVTKAVRIHLSVDNISRGVRDLHRRRAAGALYRRFLRSDARRLAQVGKYRSTSYVWRQSRHNLRRVRCADS